MKQNPYESPSLKSNERLQDPLPPFKNTRTFLKGGFGCLASFLLLGVFAVLLGEGFSLYAGTPIVLMDGKIKINGWGLVILFLFGGLCWLPISLRMQRLEQDDVEGML